MTMRYTAEEFSKHLNETFTIQHEGGKVELMLAEVKSVRSTAQAEQFSLFFQGPLTPQLQQRMYSMANERTGALDLFIVPVAQNEKGIVYEVVFNQMRQHGQAF
jgi:hypothetical protein